MSTRNETIRKLRMSGLTLAKIGKRFNISRQRINQLTKDIKIDPYAMAKAEWEKNPKLLICKYCKKKFSRPWHKRHETPIFCSDKCWNDNETAIAISKVLPKTKVCLKCGKRKGKSGYYLMNRKLKSGHRVLRYPPSCKTCSKKQKS